MQQKIETIKEEVVMRKSDVIKLREKYNSNLITLENYLTAIEKIIENYGDLSFGYTEALPIYELFEELPNNEKFYDIFFDIYMNYPNEMTRNSIIRLISERFPNKFLELFSNFILKYEQNDDIIIYSIQKWRDLTLEFKEMRFRDRRDILNAEKRLGERKYQEENKRLNFINKNFWGV